MITLIFGTNIALSRKYYIDTKQATPNPLTLDGASVTLSALTQALEGQELFASQTQVFIEEFLSKKRIGKEIEQLLEYLSHQGKTNTIVMWESKELTPKQIASLGKPEIKRFDIPKEVFAFLDSLFPRNIKQSMTLFHKVLQTEEPEFVFFMIVRQFRILLALSEQNALGAKQEEGWRGGKVSDGAHVTAETSTDGKEPATGPRYEHNEIDEVKRLAPWQKSKLLKQSNSFGKERLVDCYHDLFSIEQGLKTGQLGQTLEQAIDFFLSTL